MEGGLSRGRICNRAYGFKRMIQSLTFELFDIQMPSAENIRQEGPKYLLNNIGV